MYSSRRASLLRTWKTSHSMFRSSKFPSLPLEVENTVQGWAGPGGLSTSHRVLVPGHGVLLLGHARSERHVQYAASSSICRPFVVSHQALRLLESVTRWAHLYATKGSRTHDVPPFENAEHLRPASTARAERGASPAGLGSRQRTLRPLASPTENIIG